MDLVHFSISFISTEYDTLYAQGYCIINHNCQILCGPRYACRVVREKLACPLSGTYGWKQSKTWPTQCEQTNGGKAL